MVVDLIRVAITWSSIVVLAVAAAAMATGGVADSVYTDAKGMPLDWAGKHLRCRDSQCPGLLTWTSNYDYECDKCGLKATCRMDSYGLDWGE